MRPLIFIMLFCFGWLGSANAGTTTETTHTDWDALLRRHVHWSSDGTTSTVDYAGLAAERDALRQYLQRLATVSPTQFAKVSVAEQQAFLINAYNAATIELILQRWPKLDSIRDLGSWLRSPWQLSFVELLGETRSLDDIEHTLLRGAAGFSEPRIHFAVNCASIGCPALRPEAYHGTHLEAQLQDQTKRFLRDRSRNRFEDDRLQVSRIFDWYGDDFASVGGVANFLANHADALGLDGATASALREGAIDIAYLPYDWSLNRSQP